MDDQEEKLSKSFLMMFTEKEQEAIELQAKEEGTEMRNLIRRALKSYFTEKHPDLPESLFNDRKQGNRSKESRVAGLNRHAALNAGTGAATPAPAL